MEVYEGEHDDLKKATVAYIASQLISKQERKRLSTLFRHFDKDGSGIIDIKELRKGLSGIVSKEDFEKAEREIQELFDKVDTDGNGMIEFQEFLVAAMDKNDLLSDANLQAAFDAFDIDGNG